MKKILYFAFTFAIICCAAFSSYAYEHEDFYAGAEKGEVINVFNWGEYISDSYEDGMLDVNKEFEKLTGIKVNYVTFESNEDMYAKIKNGGASYDIIIPSDYMIERMIDEDLVQKFDPTKLPNYHYVDEKYKGMYYDENNEYSVPYNVGMVGLIYNTKMVKERPTSWKVMWDEQYAGKILMIDNPRDAFAIPQKIMGYSLNSTDEKELADVAQMLIDQKPLLQSYVMDEVFNKMESGEAAMVPYYVGDYIIMKDVNPDLDFVYPEEGVNIFVDAICIPKAAQNVDAALKYINFLLDPEIALNNALYIGYATANTGVYEMDDYAEMMENEYLYPSEENMPNVEYFHNLPQETLTMFSTLWNDIKASGGSNVHIYIGFAVVGAVTVGYLIYSKVRKKRREYWYSV
ncbi:MAG: spermidine/putrescine ABC transporter substrate-binding protein [Faecalibacterium sp.]|nr:spermidine/putrescine ABC transporter substrate-binding protein [Ruminococcus sp.]MCM1392373.1 spermidine/putrescine ABC transporter substrate-binding protein [Ruminococcus sp.]MCM1486689.1 spermidine/putrescine ABC transporter substrate-binding protein [Faecalibacterium sp.]